MLSNDSKNEDFVIWIRVGDPPDSQFVSLMATAIEFIPKKSV